MLKRIIALSFMVVVVSGSALAVESQRQIERQTEQAQRGPNQVRIAELREQFEQIGVVEICAKDFRLMDVNDVLKAVLSDKDRGSYRVVNGTEECVTVAKN